MQGGGGSQHCCGVPEVEGSGREVSTLCLLHISENLVFRLFSRAVVGRTVCSQGTEVHPRGEEGGVPYSPHLQANGPPDPSVPSHGKSLGLNRALWPELVSRAYRRSSSGESRLFSEANAQELRKVLPGSP
jgi:hypothetical protein